MSSDIKLKDEWYVEHKIIPLKDVDLIFSKKIIITIKNHSPFIRRFEIGTNKIYFRNNYNALKFRLYYNLVSPIFTNVGKYSKQDIEIKIPKVPLPDDGYIIIYVKNLDKNEIREFTFSL